MNSMPILFRLLLVLAVLVGSLDPSWAEQAQDDQAHVGQPQVDGGCAIRHVHYTVRLVEPVLSGSPGEPLRITIRLDPDTMPIGYFVSTNIRILSAPAIPDILPGFPEITVICPEPGDYLLEVTATLITRTSCVGVSTCSLPGQRVTLRIEPLLP